MNREDYKKIILEGRSILTFFSKFSNRPSGYISDQEAGADMPPRTKERMTDDVIDLPAVSSDVIVDNDFFSVLSSRRTQRKYSGKDITPEQLAYLLWCAQGIRRIPARSSMSFRTVASGGGKHPFEMYMVIRHVEGMDPGLYHYLPLTDQVEYLGSGDNLEEFAVKACAGQTWAAKASVIFFLCADPRRTEWRYGVYAHPLILMDAGHVSENMYLAAASLKLGCCAVAKIDPEIISTGFGLDPDEEFPVLGMTIGVEFLSNS